MRKLEKKGEERSMKQNQEKMKKACQKGRTGSKDHE